MKNTIHVIGSGKLGSLLLRRTGFSPLICDLTKPESIESAIEKEMPTFIINMGGMTNIDKCEANYELALSVNVKGTTNLHSLFSKVLTISTDHVFSGKTVDATEKTPPNPVNNYGFSKLGAEAVSRVYGGKVVRLSRTVSIEDTDISDYLLRLYGGETIYVPTFIYRNFIHRQHAVDGIVYFAENYKSMPQTLHYAGEDNYSFYNFMLILAEEFGFDVEKVQPRHEQNNSYSPRPMNGGFSVAKAKKLGFPMYKITDAVAQLTKEANL